MIMQNKVCANQGQGRVVFQVQALSCDVAALTHLLAFIYDTSVSVRQIGGKTSILFTTEPHRTAAGIRFIAQITQTNVITIKKSGCA